MNKRSDSRVMHVADAIGHVPGPAGEHAVTLLRRGPVDVRYAVAVSPERQTPIHEQDEFYFVIRGRGVLFHGGARDPFEAGDLLFVPAGTEHRFEESSQDLAVWVVFHGPRGGEVPVR